MKRLAKIAIVLLFIIAAAGFIFFAGGYELRCYDLHGGNKCEIKKPPEPATEETPISNPLAVFQCKTDADCVITDSGACTLKGLFNSGKSDSAQKCVCLTGPVVYGCMPEDQASQFTPAEEQPEHETP